MSEDTTPAIHPPLVKIIRVQVTRLYILDLTFDDGTTQVVDLEPILYGPIYGPLRDQDLFLQVRLDPDFPTVTWPNGADFDPATLWNWPNERERWIAWAAQWKS